MNEEFKTTELKDIAPKGATMSRQLKGVSPEKGNTNISVYKTERYQSVYNSQAMSLLSRFNTNCVTGEPNVITGNVTYNIDDLKVTITNDEAKDEETIALFIAFTPNTAKVLDVLSLMLARKIPPKSLEKDIAPEVQFTIDEYLSLCGKPLTKSNRDSARKIITKALQTLYTTNLSFKEKIKGKNKTFFDMRLCTKKGVIDNNVVVFRFTPEFAQYIVSSYITNLDTRILQLDSNNQNAYPLYRKMLTHYGMDNNIKRGNNNIISVKAALENCPDIPTYETIKATDRHYSRIPESLITALECISKKTNMKWEFYTQNKEPIGDDVSEITPKEFLNLYIKFELEEFPDQSERIKEKEKERKRKEQARKRKAEQKKKAAEQEA